MRSNIKLHVLGRFMLVAATVTWGASFVLLKNTLDSLSPLWIMGIRFYVGALIILLISFKHLRLINRKYIKVGLLLGGLLFFAYLFQTYGLIYTTPGKNAFLTSAYCVMVPFFGRMVFKTRLRRSNVAAAFICLAGVGFVSLDSGFSVNIGDILTLICSVFFAFQIIVLDKSVKAMDIRLITMLQFAVVAVISFILAPIIDGVPESISADMLPGLAYVCIMSTVVAYFLQLYGQKYSPPSEAALLLSLESVFGTLASVIFYHENITPRLLIGFLLIFIAITVSEAKPKIPRFLRGKRKNQEELH